MKKSNHLILIFISLFSCTNLLSQPLSGSGPQAMGYFDANPQDVDEGICDMYWEPSSLELPPPVYHIDHAPDLNEALPSHQSIPHGLPNIEVDSGPQAMNYFSVNNHTLDSNEALPSHHYGLPNREVNSGPWAMDYCTVNRCEVDSGPLAMDYSRVNAEADDEGDVFFDVSSEVNEFSEPQSTSFVSLGSDEDKTDDFEWIDRSLEMRELDPAPTNSPNLSAQIANQANSGAVFGAIYFLKNWFYGS